MPRPGSATRKLVGVATKLRRETRRRAVRGPQRLPRPRRRRAQEARHQAHRRRPEAHPPRRELARREPPRRHRQKFTSRAGSSADPLRGLLRSQGSTARPVVVEYEPDRDLRDTEQVPLLEDGGIEAFIRREVLPYTPDAWIKADATKIGYEISFTRHFYKPQPLRTLDEIRADILAVEKEAEGLLDQLITGAD